MKKHLLISIFIVPVLFTTLPAFGMEQQTAATAATAGAAAQAQASTAIAQESSAASSKTAGALPCSAATISKDTIKDLYAKITLAAQLSFYMPSRTVNNFETLFAEAQRLGILFEVLLEDEHNNFALLAAIVTQPALQELVCNACIQNDTYKNLTLLHKAMQEKRESLARHLINAKANVHAKMLSKGDAEGKNIFTITPLMVASLKIPQLIPDLLAAKADLEQTTPPENPTALVLATRNSQYESVVALLDAKANVYHKASNGQDMFQIACKYCRKQPELIAIIRNVYNATLPPGASPLYSIVAISNLPNEKQFAASLNQYNDWKEDERNHLKAAIISLETEQNCETFFKIFNSPNYRNICITGCITPGNRTLLYYAFAYAKYHVMAALLAAGANPNHPSHPDAASGKLNTDAVTTPLRIAIAKHDMHAINLLFAHKADANMPNEIGETPLMLACYMNFPVIADILLQNNANLNVQDQDGLTALMIAVLTNNPALVHRVLQANPNLTLVSHYPHPSTRQPIRKTALQFAQTAVAEKLFWPQHVQGQEVTEVINNNLEIQKAIYAKEVEQTCRVIEKLQTSQQQQRPNTQSAPQAMQASNATAQNNKEGKDKKAVMATAATATTHANLPPLSPEQIQALKAAQEAERQEREKRHLINLQKKEAEKQQAERDIAKDPAQWKWKYDQTQKDLNDPAFDIFLNTKQLAKVKNLCAEYQQIYNGFVACHYRGPEKKTILSRLVRLVRRKKELESAT